MNEVTICAVTGCYRPSDGWIVCKTCGDEVASTLSNVEWLMEQLDLAVTRQTRYGSRNGGRSTEIPLPVNMKASDVQHYLVNEVTTTARMIAEDNSWDEPEGPLSNVADWLIYNISAIRLNTAGGAMVDNLVSICDKATHVIDKPKQRQYLGNCEDQNHGDMDREVCPGAVYGMPGDDFAQCDTCRTRWIAEQIREQLLKTLDNRLCTAAEIAKLSTYLGLKANREQVRNRVNVWAKRGRISRYGIDSDDAPTYQFGIVWRLLMHEDATRDKAS